MTGPGSILDGLYLLVAGIYQKGRDDSTNEVEDIPMDYLLTVSSEIAAVVAEYIAAEIEQNKEKWDKNGTHTR